MSLTRQSFTVTLADGRELTATPGNPDTIRWEMTAAKRWPELLPKPIPGTDQLSFPAPIVMQTFITWAALTREGLYDGKFEDFRDRDCLEVEPLEAEDVDPTPAAPAPGPLST